MTTPLDRLIDASVRCVKCGAKGVGTCNCWTAKKKTPKKRGGSK